LEDFLKTESKRFIEATLVASDIGKKDGKYFVMCEYQRFYPDQSFESYRRFYSLQGDGLEITLKELGLQGFNGKVSELCSQGKQNKSTVLSFGETFLLEIEMIKGKMGVNAVRKTGTQSMQSSVGKEEAEAFLGDISVKRREVFNG
jgi:hypothetical protein